MERVGKIKELLKLDPDDSFLHHALALELVKAGDDDEAKKHFEHILNHDPGYIGSYYHLGKLLERQGDEKTAIEVYQKGMDMAQSAGDRHALGELRSAYEELTM